jgi:L-iditol 2-dehydrogenase
MKAVVLEEKGKMTYRELPTPEPRAGHYLLRVRAASICGSDLHRFTRGHKVTPLVLGHEAAGEIVAAGAGADPALIGRHAAVIPLVPCFECAQCRAGRYSACKRYSFIGSRQNGGYAEFVELPARNVLLLPEALAFEAAALVEPSSVARHILDLGEFQPGHNVVVLGAGSIGLMAVQWLRILGAGQIIASDPALANRQAALELGASAVLDPQQVDLVQAVHDLTGDGADLALETAGVPQTLQQAIHVVHPGGMVVCAGNQPLDASLPMTWVEELERGEVRLRGCFMSYSAPFPGHEWTDSVQALLSGQLNWAGMISHRFPLSQAPEVFAQMAARAFAYRKIILTP